MFHIPHVVWEGNSFNTTYTQLEKTSCVLTTINWSSLDFYPLLSSLNQQRQKDAGQNETLDVSVQAISSCDMVSSLSSVRKKTVWEI